MFYSIEILSLRRNGKLAKCWLAAHMTSRDFHTKFRRNSIASIDVIQICDDVIEHIIAQNNRPRFSLYLAAHLMFGIARICSYQTKRLYDDLCSFWADYNVPIFIEGDAGKKKQRRPKKTMELPVFDITLPPAEPPKSVHTMSVPESHITITEHNGISTVLPILTEPHFGALTEEELDIMLRHDGLPFVPSPSQAVRSVPEPALSPITPGIAGLSRMPSPIIQPRTEDFAEAEIPIIGPVELPAPDEVVGESFPTQVLRPREERPQTPKRPRLPRSPNGETPPKIRRVSVADDVGEAPVVPIPVEPSAATSTSTSSASTLHLQPLGVEALSLPIRMKKKRRVVDQYTKLGRPSDDPFVHTRVRTSEQDHARIHAVTSAVELLTTPSMGRNMAKCLLLDYQMIIVQPIMDDSEARPKKEKKKTKLPKPTQPMVRHPDTTGETTGGLTSGHEMGSIISRPDESTTDRTKTFEIIPITEGTILPGQPDGSSIEREETHDIGLHPVPGLPGVSEQLDEISMIQPDIVRRLMKDWEQNGESYLARSPVSRKPVKKDAIVDISLVSPLLGRPSIQETPTTRSFTPTQKPLVKADLIATLRAEWSGRKLVTFEGICPPSLYARRDAVKLFQLLLELHATKDLQLKQARPDSPIYILQYSPDY